METKKIYSATIPKLFYVFVVAIIIGAMADFLLLSTTLQDLDIGSAVAALFPREFQTIVAVITSFLLSFCICLLGIAFMFKAGSSSVENKVKRLWRFHTEYSLIVLWFALGVGLSVFRYMYKPNDGANILLAIVLFVLYLGTGVTAYLLGQMIGNPYLSKYRKIEKKLINQCKNELQNCHDDLQDKNNICVQIQNESEQTLSKYLSYYNLIDELLDEWGDDPMISPDVDPKNPSPIDARQEIPTVLDRVGEGVPNSNSEVAPADLIPTVLDTTPAPAPTVVEPHPYQPQTTVSSDLHQLPTFVEPTQYIQDLANNNTEGEENGR
jgi:hypothetical protein